MSCAVCLICFRMAECERLFLALWPEVHQQRNWAAQAQKLLPAGCGRLVPAQNLHITLLYLGGLSLETRQVLEQKLECIHAQPFVLMLDQFGYWRRPQVFWWGAKQTPAPLEQLVQALRQAAKICGLEVEHRPYRAHLTLARKVRRAPGRISVEPFEWAIKEFVLVRSTLLPLGAQYEVVRRWPLSEKA